MLTTTGNFQTCRSVNGECGCKNGCNNGETDVENIDSAASTAGDDSASPNLAEAISFVNPTGQVVVTVLNRAGSPQQVSIVLDGAVVVANVSLPAASMSTFTVDRK